MSFKLIGKRKPALLVDVIGVVVDDDGLTTMLVYRKANGRFYASQAECDIELNVIAWAPMPGVPAYLKMMYGILDTWRRFPLTRKGGVSA